MAKAKSKIKVAEFDKILGAMGENLSIEAERLAAHIASEGFCGDPLEQLIAAESDELQDDEPSTTYEEPEAEVLKPGLTAREARRAQAEALINEPISDKALEILEAACDNVAKSTGDGIADDDARAEIALRSAVFVSCNADLDDVVAARIEVADDIDQALEAISRDCFAVQKSANFIANRMYRNALNTEKRRGALEDTAHLVRTRFNREGFEAYQQAESTEPPCGMGEDDASEFGLRADVEVLLAHNELHAYLEAVTLALGHTPITAMPFMYERRGTPDSPEFIPIYDGERALDIMEIQSATRRATRRAAGLDSSQRIIAMMAAKKAAKKAAIAAAKAA